MSSEAMDTGSFDLWLLLSRHANCRDLDDPDVMFPDPDDVFAVAQAKSACHRCFVQQACGEFADRLGVSDGVWGGRLRTATSTVADTEVAS